MKAYRGDLVIVEYRQSSTYARGGGKESTPTFDLERVSAITRDGDVKSTIKLFSHKDMPPELFFHKHKSRFSKEPVRTYRVGYRACHIVSQALVDVDAAWFAWDARTVRDWFPESFASLEEAREWLAQFKVLMKG